MYVNLIAKKQLPFQPHVPTKNAKKVCAVSTCNNPKDVSYHTFPKNEEIQKIWVAKCRRSDSFNPRTSHVCEHHFDLDAYERDLKAELLGLPPKKRLKKQAIPSLHLPTGASPSCLEASLSRQKRQKKREEDGARADIINALLTEEFSELPSLPATEESVHSNQEEDHIMSKHVQTDAVVSTDVATSCDIMANVPQLRSKVVSLEKKLSSAQVQLMVLKKEVKRLQSGKFQNDLVKKTLEKLHSPAQTRRLLNKETKYQRGYTKEDVVTALIIKTSSPKLFRFLKAKKLLALPSMRTQEKYLRHFTCEPGILHDSIFLLKKKMDNEESSHSKLAVLCIDEINTRKLYEWCPRQKKVYGPHKKLQVAQVRGLTHSWKQPIYASFDTTMTKMLLFQIMEELDKSGVTVTAIVFDMANTALISQLHLSPETYSFKHPTDPSQQVFCFPDVPHLLKLFRNHLLDDGYDFLGRNGCYASLAKSDLEDLISRDSGELRIMYKVTPPAHLDCKGSARQRVRTAAQLLSGTVAKALRYLFGEAHATQAEAIEVVNNWFDTMNSCQMNSKKKLSCAFGIHYSEQLHALTKMETLIKTMKIKGKKTMLPFQKGILMSINAIKGLHEACSNQGLTFIMTTHVNQDNLENLFSRIRCITANNTHPSPVEAMRRLRILLIGGGHDIVVKNPAVMEEMSDQEDYIDPSTETQCVSKIATKDITDRSLGSGSYSVSDEPLLDADVVEEVDS